MKVKFNKFWLVIIGSMFLLFDSAWSMESDGDFEAVVGVNQLEFNTLDAKEKYSNHVEKGSINFEFWYKTGRHPIYVRFGTIDQWNEAGDNDELWRKVEVGQRVWSRDNIVQLAYSDDANPEYADQINYHIFDPNKKVFVRLNKQDKKGDEFGPQTGPGSKLLTFGRETLKIPPGTLGTKTASGLSFTGNIISKDMLWLPYPFLPYSNEYQLFNMIRNSADDVELVSSALDIEVENREREKNDQVSKTQVVGEAILRGWTPLHEAALWKYGKVYDLLEIFTVSRPDDDGITPEQLYDGAQESGVLRFYPAVIKTYYLEEIKREESKFYKGDISAREQRIQRSKNNIEGFRAYEAEKFVEKVRSSVDSLITKLSFGIDKIEKGVTAVLQKLGTYDEYHLSEIYDQMKQNLDTIKDKLSKLLPRAKPGELYTYFEEDFKNNFAGTQLEHDIIGMYKFLEIDNDTARHLTIDKLSDHVLEQVPQVGVSPSDELSPDNRIWRQIGYITRNEITKDNYDAFLLGPEITEKIGLTPDQKEKVDKLLFDKIVQLSLQIADINEKAQEIKRKKKGTTNN